ncbi:MAG: zinc-ribbon and DUF3426 domain-containing protein [Thiobacillaceae bacterium]|jgi:predicted Zn finger-like uncharacterized protein
MTLHTTCSNCHSVFRITEPQLAAADGWAQCGVCAAPFDALLGMSDDERALYLTPPEPEPVSEVAAEAPAAEPSGSTVEHKMAASALSPAETVSETATAAKEAEDTPPATSNLPGLERRFAAEVAETAGTPHSDLPSIIIVDPDAKAPEDDGAMPDIQEPSARPYGYPVHELEDDDDEEYENEHVAEAGMASVSRPAPSEASFAESGKSGKRISGWLWIVMPLLLVLLFGQLAYFLRDPMAARYPELRPLLSSACDIVGCQMGLPQDVAQIKILGSDLQADPGNSKRLTLALTLANQASYPQAWPMLQLTLTDTRDNPLARRVFAPSEYLNHPGMQKAGIPALSETPLSLHLETQDLNASGFRVEVFY